MTAVRWKFAYGLAVLLAVATAAADTIVTTQEVVSCSVESASADSIRLKLTQGGITALSARDVYEIRLSDSSRVAELAAQLPQLRITVDSGQYVPPPAVRARRMVQLRLDLAREARAKCLPWHADVIDTLPHSALPDEMAERCLDMGTALLAFGPHNEAAFVLVREVTREQDALRRVWPKTRTDLASGAVGGIPVSYVGGFIGDAIHPAGVACGDVGGGCPGAIIGCAAGSAVGAAIGRRVRAGIVARHRDRVNGLIRRVNHVVASQP